jgi:hypothetical protein
VLVVPGALEVHRHHVPAARVPARQLNVGVLQGATVARSLVMIQKKLYLQLPVQNYLSVIFRCSLPILPYPRGLAGSLSLDCYG